MKPLGAHLMTSCWNVSRDLPGPMPQTTGVQRPAITRRVRREDWTCGGPAAIDEEVWERGEAHSGPPGTAQAVGSAGVR